MITRLGVLIINMSLIAGIAIVNLSCTKYRIEYSVFADLPGNYVLDETTQFSKTATIFGSDVSRAFNVPEDAEDLRIEIQELAAEATVLSGNTAGGIVVTGVLRSDAYGVDTLFRDFPIPLVEIGGLSPINELIQSGIGKLKQNLTDFVNKNYGGPYDAATINLIGHPTNGRAAVNLNLRIKATLTYGVCQYTFPIAEEPGCD